MLAFCLWAVDSSHRVQPACRTTAASSPVKWADCLPVLSTLPVLIKIMTKVVDTALQESCRQDPVLAVVRAVRSRAALRALLCLRCN